MTITENKISELFEELVPNTGKADTVAGEIIRAICRIGYRYYNEGDHIGVGYGNETCNPAARYLMNIGDEQIDNAISNMWGVYSDSIYEEWLDKLEKAVLEYLESNPDLKTAVNKEDMWDYRADEDVDDYDEEEDW